MSDIDQRIKELEETLHETESALQQAQMPEGNSDAKASTSYSYKYIIAILIPIITFGVLYFAKPSWVTKKSKGKQVIDMPSLLKWTAIITAIGWAILFALNYFGVFSSSTESSSE